MRRLIGTETEYGLHVEGADPAQMLSESRAVVLAYAGPCVATWHYGCEDPRQDMRGYRVADLSRSPEDLALDAAGPHFATLADEQANRILGNGGRLYNDHGHPEYSTPECTSLTSLVAYDRAGERTVLECARRYAASSGKTVRVYKNNTDYHGACYGTHECYLMRRDVPVDVLITALAPFLATRQIFAGAGKVGSDLAGSRSVPYQISQRAEFVEVLASVDTQWKRPLFNTRDEPHADPSRYRRLHVICGDANMSEWATAMKVGTLALVLDLVETGWRPQFELSDPVRTVQEIARDPSLTLRMPVRSCSNRSVSDMRALDIQRVYCDAAATAQSDLPERDWVLAEWAAVLDDLERAPEVAADRVDWVLKRSVLREYSQACGQTPSLQELRSVDLAYHDLSPEDSLFVALRDHEHRVRRLVTDNDVEQAMYTAPTDSRAAIRAHFVNRYHGSVRSASWGTMVFQYHDTDHVLDMSSLVDGCLAETNAALGTAETMDDTIAALTRCESAKLRLGPTKHGREVGI